MVSTVKMLACNTIVGRRPLVMELVGPAGAGKTTLLRALCQHNKKILAGVRLRRIGHIPFLIGNALFLLPTFLQRYRHSRWFTWEETRSMIYLKAWHHVLGREASENGIVTVLDHGPIYRLALLREFGPEITQSQRFEDWWERMLKQWAATLDIIVCLDAPDAILVKRIHARSRWHLIKEKSEQEAYKLLERYRTSYELMISALAANGGPRVLRFDTAQESLSQIVKQVLAASGLEHGEG